jgi:hypothetical protein
MSMKVLSRIEAEKQLQVSDLCEFFEEINWKHSGPKHNYRIPSDPGEIVGLARVIVNFFLDQASLIVWITETGVWPSAEHLDLFTRYRLSHNEKRDVKEAPVHIIEAREGDAAISILCISLLFSWDIELMSRDRSIAVTFSHDGWMELRHSPDHGDIAVELQKWIEKWKC